MKYLCLIAAETMLEGMTEAEAERHIAEYRELMGSLVQSGHYVACNRLQPPEAAITVRVRRGKVLTTDGPFAETKEQLGGYFLIDAMDMNEAIQVAARIPGARIGCVEIRPIADDELTRQALDVPSAESQL